MKEAEVEVEVEVNEPACFGVGERRPRELKGMMSFFVCAIA